MITDLGLHFLLIDERELDNNGQMEQIHEAGFVLPSCHVENARFTKKIGILSMKSHVGKIS